MKWWKQCDAIVHSIKSHTYTKGGESPLWFCKFIFIFDKSIGFYQIQTYKSSITMVYHGENISPNRVDTTMKLSLKCYLLYPSLGITLQTVSAYFCFHKKRHRYFTTAPFSNNTPCRKVKGLTQWYNFKISSYILFALVSSSFIKFSGATNRRNVRKANNMDRIFLGCNVV